jgi:hypothetical protein
MLPTSLILKASEQRFFDATATHTTATRLLAVGFSAKNNCKQNYNRYEGKTIRKRTPLTSDRPTFVILSERGEDKSLPTERRDVAYDFKMFFVRRKI